MTSLRDFLDFLDPMQKMIDFYHHKAIDMLKVGYTPLNLTNICLHKSTDYKFFPFFSRDSDLLEKIRDDMTGGPAIVFTRKAVAIETFIRKSNNLCKSIVGIDASQLYPHSICQDMPTGLYTRWDYDEETQKFKARQNRVRTVENMVMSYFQATRPECKIESYYTTGTQKKMIALVLMIFATIVRLSLKQWVVISSFSLAKKLDQA